MLGLRGSCSPIVTIGIDVVLTDVELPDANHMTGIDLVAAILNLPQPPPRLVVMTAHASLEIQRKTKAFGVELLEKPFNRENLMSALSRPAIHRCVE